MSVWAVIKTSLFGLSAICMMAPEMLQAQLSEPIQAIVESGRTGDSFWAVVVTDSSGRYLEDYNREKLIRPASNFKLVTSAAALHTLGPDYTYTTSLYAIGRQEGNRWNGDLLIRGAGDPSISGEFADGNALFLFEKWRERLQSMGIEQIDGNLIGNESYFDDIPYPRGWEWDDLTFYYAPEINALSFNNNAVELEVLADGPVGSTPNIQWFPFNTPYVEFINEQLITPAQASYDESYRRELGSNTIYLRSTLPQGYYESEPLTVARPSLYFLDTFKRFLEQGGIQVSGQLIPDRQPRDWSQFQLLDEHKSVPLIRMIERKNRESDNFYAEMILKTMAAETYQTEGTTELGIEIVEQFMSEAGIDTAQVRMRDGSGLAPATLIKAGDLNRLLQHIKGYDWYELYYQTLSVAGVNGTLQYRFQNSPVKNRFYGKTGFMSGIRVLTGYLTTQSGEQLVVTIATNHYTVRTSTVDVLHERILEYLYNIY
ncbi:MAG: D-alanyl-D-alanine carboxypeptidase/D-alanyl-D-alanine-endopeptidase [Balneolaceae bacterium]